MMVRIAGLPRVSPILGIAVLLATLVACGPQPLTVVTQEPVSLRIVACDACDSPVRELAAAYQTERAWVTLEVETFNTAVAAAQLRSGAADLIALPQTDSLQLPPWSVPFATSAVAIVVHPTAPIEAVDSAQLQEIFRGRTGEWANGTPIQVVSRETGAGTRSIFESRVMGEHNVALTAVVMPGDQQVLDYVASTPGAIGYVSLGQVNSGVRTLSVDGIPPTPATLDQYPLAFTLHLTTPSEPEGEARAFIEWVLSPAGRQQVDQSTSSPQ
ncbi:MAG: substrate-binding domain-containing protein [Anaerolineae bacterium]|jgi:phosphate transport system substrate-binding protein